MLSAVCSWKNKRKHSLLPFQRHLLPVSKYRCPTGHGFQRNNPKVFELQEKQSLHFDTPFVAPHHLFFPEKQHFPGSFFKRLSSDPLQCVKVVSIFYRPQPLNQNVYKESVDPPQDKHPLLITGAKKLRSTGGEITVLSLW